MVPYSAKFAGYAIAAMVVLFFLMAPLVSTLPTYFLFLLAKVLQAFIFYMLAMIYLKGAMEPAH